MDFFAQTNKTFEFEVGGHAHTVTLRKPTAREERQIRSKYVRAYRSGGDMRIDIDTELMELALVEVMLTDWSGPGFAGRPVTKENIGQLPEHVFAQIVGFCDEFAKPVDDDEKKG